MIKRLIALILMSVFCVTCISCRSNQGNSIASSPDQAPASETSSSDSAYVDEVRPETIEEKITVAAMLSNLLITSWESPNQIDPDHFFEFYEALIIMGETEMPEGEFVPADVVEAVIKQYFDVETDYIKTSNYYEEQTDSYFVGGLGNVLDLVIDDKSTKEQTLMIAYSLYFNDELQRSGVLSVQVDGDETYKYLSNSMK